MVSVSTSFLSIIMSVILAIAGTGIPAIPQTATTYTLSNLCLSVAGEELKLEPALKLTEAIGSEQYMLSASIESAGETLCPITLLLSEDALAFKLGNSGNAYYLAPETVDLVSELSPMQLAELAVTIETVKTYQTALMNLLNNPEALAQIGNAAFNALIENTAYEGDTSKLEIDGESYEISEFKLRIKPEDYAKLYKAIEEADIAEYNALEALVLELINASMQGAEFHALSEIMEMALTEGEFKQMPTIPMTYRFASDEQSGVIFAESVVEYEIEGVPLTLSSTQSVSGDSASIVYDILLGDEEGRLNLNIDIEFTGMSGDAPAMNMAGYLEINVLTPAIEETIDTAATAGNIFTGSVEPAEPEHSKVYAELNLNSAVVDGMFELEGSVELTGEGELFGEKYASGSLSIVPTREADGSVTSKVELTAGDKDAYDMALSFELNVLEEAYVCPIDMQSAIELPAEMFSPDYEPNSEDPEDAMLMMSIMMDATALQSDLEKLSADPTIGMIVG